MKRFLMVVLLVCMMIQCVSYAQEIKTYSYDVTYNTGSEDEVKPQTVVSRNQNTTVSIRSNIPKKDGFSFLGWSEEKTREPKKMISPGERVKISSSLELFAVWKLNGSAKIAYEDSGKQILPSQIAIGETEISRTIPKKTGYIFCGWEKSGSKDRILPGQKFETEKDMVLTPVWERGSLPEPGVEIESFADGRVTFSLKNTDFFEKVQLVAKNLTTREEKISEVTTDNVETNMLPEGPYETWVLVTHKGIEYKTDPKKFVVHSGIVGEDSELSLWMEGEELRFDMPPVLLESHTYIALRHFCESMGAKVEWNDANRSATIYYSGIIIKVFENSNKCILNGETRFLPVPTKILSGSMFIPLRSIAELCRCEIVWDESRKVYIFPEDEGVFENNIVNLVNENGKYISVTDGELAFSEEPGYACGWIFQAVDEKNDIYEIYNITELEKPLMVNRSEVLEGQTVILGDKDGFDGCLWKINKLDNGEITIQPCGNSGLFFGGSPFELSTFVNVFKAEVAN